MNKTFGSLCKFFLRIIYWRILISGVGLSSMSITLLLSNYKVSSHQSFDVFLIVTSGVIGFVITIIGLVYNTEVKHQIKKLNLTQKKTTHNEWLCL